MKPYFSIVIASLNNEKRLINCINSINDQVFKSYEVLISDGGSVDGTISLLNSSTISNLTWSKSSKDNGIYEALNIALSHASGEWVLVLGSDDCLAHKSALHDANKSIESVAQKPLFFYSNIIIRSKSEIRQKIYPNIDEFEKSYGGAPFFHHQSIFFNRRAFKDFNYFDLRYRIHADYDLLLRAHNVNRAKKIDSHFVVYSDDGYSSKVKNILKSYCEIFIIRQRNGMPGFSWRITATFIRLLLNKISKFFFNT